MHPSFMLQLACTRGALEFIIYSSLDHVNCLPVNAIVQKAKVLCPQPLPHFLSLFLSLFLLQLSSSCSHFAICVSAGWLPCILND